MATSSRIPCDGAENHNFPPVPLPIADHSGRGRARCSLVLAFCGRGEFHRRTELQREASSRRGDLPESPAPAVDQFYTQVAEQSVANGPRNAEQRRALLERSLEFYRGMESKASSPKERARVRVRVEQLRTQIDDVLRSNKGKS